MGLPRSTVRIPFAQGLDTKTDEKQVEIGKLTRLENGVFTKGGSIKKRPGSVRLDTALVGLASNFVDEALAIATRDDELVLFGEGAVRSYAEGAGGWLTKGGPCESLAVSTSTPARVGYEQVVADRATGGGVTVYAWEDARSGGAGVRYSVIDAETGAVYTADQYIGANSAQPRCIAIAGTVHLLYVDTSTNYLKSKKFTANSYAQSAINVTPIKSAPSYYDACVVGERALIVYMNAAGTKFVAELMSESGVVAGGNSFELALSGTPKGVGCCYLPELDRVGIVTSDSGNGTYATYATPAILATSAHSEELANAAASASITQATVAWNPLPEGASVGVLYALWEVSAADAHNHYVRIRGVTTSGSVGLVSTLKRHSGLASKAWTGPYGVCVNLVHSSPLQSTYFTVKATHSGTADGGILARLLPGTAGGLVSKPHLPQVEQLADGRYAWAGIAKTRLESAPTYVGVHLTDESPVFTERYIKDIVLDWSDSDTYRTAQVGGALYVTGGQLWQYDGRSAVESGFHLYPEDITLTPGAAASGEMAAGTYYYRVYYEWVNARGEREQSSWAAVKSEVAAADGSIELEIGTLDHTAKRTTAIAGSRRAVGIAIYRSTLADPTVLYRVTSLDPSSADYVTNDTAADTVTWTDDLHDDDIVGNELDYQNGTEFDNVAPEPASVMCAGEDRIFLAGFEDPTEVRYSKLHVAGVGVGFNEALSIDVDDEGGAITALAIMNEALVVFKKRRIYLVTGDGYDNVGAGGGYSPASLVTTDVGCQNQRSIVMIPAGLMFQSEKGIYLLDKAFQIHYIGAPVEAYNGQQITSAVVVADTNQVRFLAASGPSLVYDYFFNQWGTFTPYSGTDATLWRGAYVRANAGGEVFQDSSSAFTDNGAAYKLVMEVAWITSQAGLQGVQRIRRAHVIGTYRSAHVMRMSVGYDYEAGFTPVSWDTADAISGTGWAQTSGWAATSGWGGGRRRYQWKTHLARQKCQAIRFRFEDVQDSPGESYQLTELALEVGLKPGLFKLPSSRTAT